MPLTGGERDHSALGEIFVAGVWGWGGAVGQGCRQSRGNVLGPVSLGTTGILVGLLPCKRYLLM